MDAVTKETVETLKGLYREAKLKIRELQAKAPHAGNYASHEFFLGAREVWQKQIEELQYDCSKYVEEATFLQKNAKA